MIFLYGITYHKNSLDTWKRLVSNDIWKKRKPEADFFFVYFPNFLSGKPAGKFLSIFQISFNVICNQVSNNVSFRFKGFRIRDH